MWDAPARRPTHGRRFRFRSSKEGTQMSAERAAIVTGASSGIGLAIARVLAEEGFAVTMAARRPEKLDAAVAGLAEGGLDGYAIAAQVAHAEEVGEGVEAHPG